MMDKYPNLSPYSYCAWNPIMLIDPDGNDWYEYTDEKTKEKKIAWTECHSQTQMSKENVNGKYLGVTVEDGNTYYSLFNTVENLETPEGRLVQAIDREIIKYARCIRMGGDVENIKYDDFSGIYKFDRQMIGGINFGGTNVLYGSELRYAGADNVQVMVSQKNMLGRLESISPTNKPLTGLVGGCPKVEGYRFNIVRKGGDCSNPIVAFSYRQKSQADGFSDKVTSMCSQGIFPTLKQMKRVNGNFQQISKYD